ncbi:MAG: hypothetical protein PUB39_02700 [Eubacteriales bacterium]|nr:hypothetical protein [Eubacteriales bacterium]
MSEFGIAVKRARNVIWNAAGDYGVSTAFLACSGNDDIDFYLNNVIGFTYKWLGEDNVNGLFDRFIGLEDQAACEALAWCALEKIVYSKEIESRPALSELRENYANEELGRLRANVSEAGLVLVLTVLYKSMLGEKKLPSVGGRERALIRGLNLEDENGAPVEITEPGVVTEHIRRSIFTYYRLPDNIGIKEKKQLKKWNFTIWHVKKQNAFAMIRDPEYMEKKAEEEAEEKGNRLSGLGGSGGIFKRKKKTEEESRETIREYFGDPVFSRQMTEFYEREICTGGHRGVKLYFAGVNISSDNFAEERSRHVAHNRNFYIANRPRFNNAMKRLSMLISNAILTRQADEFFVSRAGSIDSVKAWRGGILSDEKIFLRKDIKAGGDLCVTFLLDASASQKDHQEVIAAEAYIIAEALRMNGIDTQILSYSSLEGFTIINMLKEKPEGTVNRGDSKKDQGVFGYTAMGCSRDGLALRAARKLIDDRKYRYNLMLVLTDACPNDDASVPYSGVGFQARQYTGKDAVHDTAQEVRAAQADDITVDAIIFSEDDIMSSAKEIYGDNFIRIHKLDELAGAAGQFIQSEIVKIYDS